MGEKLGLNADKHCLALDGVRGIAALSVVFFHLGRWLDIPLFAVNGGLSVDTFFTLSGYVLARAYTERMPTLSTSEFMTLRLIRLMPVIILSLFIGASYVIARNYVNDGQVPINSVIAAFLLGSMSLPYFGAPSSIGGPQVFPLNGPQFSLFFEIVANCFWWLLRFVDQVSISLSLFLISSLVVFGYGIGGDSGENFLLGFPHVGSSFFSGVLVYHCGVVVASPRVRQCVFYGLLALMIVVFFSPFELSPHERLLWKLVLAPMLVWSGSAVGLPEIPARVSAAMGELSYPVYALHYPIFCWVNGIVQKIHGGRSSVVEGSALLILSVAASYLVIRYFDRPVRAHLTHWVFALRSVGRPATP